jgi:hypothetical protein
MADLVSGNLKEEKGAHSIQLVHSGGLLPRHATCCFQNRSDAADPGPQCTFGWKRAKTATPGTLGQPNDGVTVAISPSHSLTLAGCGRTNDVAGADRYHIRAALTIRPRRVDKVARIGKFQRCVPFVWWFLLPTKCVPTAEATATAREPRLPTKSNRLQSASWNPSCHRYLAE